MTKVYRGLPHQWTGTHTLWRDLFTTRNRNIGGYRFYTTPAALPAVLNNEIAGVLKRPSLYHPYGGPKICGAYHPDYCFEWQSSKATFYALLCRGCCEMRLIGGGATVHCDVGGDAAKELDDLLKKLESESAGWRP